MMKVMESCGTPPHETAKEEGTAMVQQQLHKIFESETAEHWNSAYWQYRELYTRCSSQMVTAHFGFYCWYLLWKWDEISVPGEIFSAFKQYPAQLGGEISRTELIGFLDRTCSGLLGEAEQAPLHYLAALVHVQRECPCFFEQDTFSDEIRMRMQRYLESRTDASAAVRALLAFQHRPEPDAVPVETRQEMVRLFPERSLMRRYFQTVFKL